MTTEKKRENIHGSLEYGKIAGQDKEDMPRLIQEAEKKLNNLFSRNMIKDEYFEPAYILEHTGDMLEKNRIYADAERFISGNGGNTDLTVRINENLALRYGHFRNMYKYFRINLENVIRYTNEMTEPKSDKQRAAAAHRLETYFAPLNAECIKEFREARERFYNFDELAPEDRKQGAKVFMEHDIESLRLKKERLANTRKGE